MARIVRIAVVFIGASVGLRKWFCKKILRWVVSLKETDKFNFSIFPRPLIDGHDEGVDKKVNIPSADVPAGRYASSHWRRYHLFSWNGHSCSDRPSSILPKRFKHSNCYKAFLCFVIDDIWWLFALNVKSCIYFLNHVHSVSQSHYAFYVCARIYAPTRPILAGRP